MRNRGDLLFSGQFVVTTKDLSMGSGNRMWRKITNVTTLPAGSLGVIVSKPGQYRVRYHVTIFARPILTLELRPQDIDPVDIAIEALVEIGGIGTEATSFDIEKGSTYRLPAHVLEANSYMSR